MSKNEHHLQPNPQETQKEEEAMRQGFKGQQET